MAQTNTPFLFGGDVRAAATYNGERIVFEVSSYALCFASPVWKKFLYPPFPKIPDGTESDLRIDFTEDDGEAILLLLRVAHLQFSKIPNKLPYDRLLQVAVLCDQYDCASVLRPWLEKWLADESTESVKPNQEKWLFIAWVFGRESFFVELAAVLARRVSISEEGDCLDSNGEPLYENMPPDIVESILATRLETIRKLLALPYDYLKRYEHDSPHLCRIPKDEVACKAVIYGSLIHQLQVYKLWPPVRPESVNLSVYDLGSQICRLTITFLPDVTKKKEYSYHQPETITHRKCSSISDFMLGYQEILRSIKNPTLESHRRHMETAKNSWVVEEEL